jgi:DNA-binding NtrC family response regulator
VHGVNNPLKAIEYARTHDEAIDLVVSDVILPNVSGPAAVAQIRGSHPESAVLFMSGYTDQAIVRQGSLEGTAFLQKPFTADALIRKVRQVLDAKAASLPVIAIRAGDRSSGTANVG